MIKIQQGNTIVTCDSVAEAAEFMSLQVEPRKIGSFKKKVYTNNKDKNKNSVPKSKVLWNRDEIETVLTLIKNGETAITASQNDFLLDRHTSQGIQFCYYQLKNGKGISKKIKKLLKEIDKNPGTKWLTNDKKKQKIRSHQNWTKSEIEILLEAADAGLKSSQVRKNKTLLERHVEQGIDIYFRKVKRNALMSQEVSQWIKELRQESGIPSRSILDVKREIPKQEYLIIDKKD